MNWDRFDLKTIKNVEVRRKTLKITENYKTDQLQWIKLTWGQNDWKRWGTSQNIQNNGKLQNWSITMICIDLRSKRSENPQSNNKQLASIWRQYDQNNAKLRKWSDYNELHRFDVKTIKTFELRRKTTKVIKLQWIASIWHQKDQTNAKLQKWYYFDEFGSIWRQNDQNNAKLRKWSDYNALHRFDV